MNEMNNMKEIIKNESNKFFSDFNHHKMSNAVFHKIGNGNEEKNRKKFIAFKMIFNYGIVSKMSVILACFVLLITSVFFFRGKSLYENEKNEMMGKPVSQQKINLNDTSYTDNWITFFRINKPDKFCRITYSPYYGRPEKMAIIKWHTAACLKTAAILNLLK